MADKQASYPTTVPLPPLSRAAEVAELLVGAIDLHCHSGPAAMPRILDHHEELLDAAEAKFRAVLYKDHFYAGMAHAILLEKLFPETNVKLFSGIVLNNASGGINPHAVDHAIKLGARIVWMPTLSAANHIEAMAKGNSTFPKTSQKMLDPIPLSALDANGKLTDDTREGHRPHCRGGHHPGRRSPACQRTAHPVRRGGAARRQEDDGQPPDLHRRLQRH